jgi:ribonuclease HI
MVVAYIDGGARGNPGPAGYGGIESPDGTLIDELHSGLGIATNNVAEYNGLLAALQWALDHRQTRVQIRAVVNQLDQVKFDHVRREFNKEADRLPNLGMDAAERQLDKRA